MQTNPCAWTQGIMYYTGMHLVVTSRIQLNDACALRCDLMSTYFDHLLSLVENGGLLHSRDAKFCSRVDWQQRRRSGSHKVVLCCRSLVEHSRYSSREERIIPRRFSNHLIRNDEQYSISCGTICAPELPDYFRRHCAVGLFLAFFAISHLIGLAYVN